MQIIVPVCILHQQCAVVDNSEWMLQLRLCILVLSPALSQSPLFSIFLPLGQFPQCTPDAAHFPVRDSGVSCHQTALIPCFFHRLITPSSLPSLIGLTGHLPAFILLLLNGFHLPAFLAAVTLLILYYTYKVTLEG